MERAFEVLYNARCQTLLQSKVEIVMMRLWFAFSTALIGGQWLCGAIPLQRELSNVVIVVTAVSSSANEFSHLNTEGGINTLNPYPTKPKITFRQDGTFKITVFSDLHFGENPWDVWGPQQDVNSTRLMRTVLSSEKPDYM